MSLAEDLPEADRIEGAPHPRFAQRVVGHDAALAQYAAALDGNRLHHAWLISGPRGIGKATLAWHIAKYLRTMPLDSGPSMFGDAPAQTPADLATPADHPALSRITALSDSGLFLLRRTPDEKKGHLRTVISVDEVRRLRNFFALSLPDGGYRVVIIDSADEMNVNAANALLKLLEEPPENTVFLLISHMPSRLLPTIRSRCLNLPCAPLAPDDVQTVLGFIDTDPPISPDEIQTLTRLARGSVGAAIRLHTLDGPALHRDLVSLFSEMPGFDRSRVLALAASLTARGAEQRRDLMIEMLGDLTAKLARAGVIFDPDLPDGEAQIARRLCPDIPSARRWARTQEETLSRLQRGLAVNLDAQSLILDTFVRLDETARDCLRP
ncbi:DNA polymerase III subunit delta' [Qingshengfaniella alkalisoli]|uniref:DNA polymerase III subunit delta n=1 Tax=Qingshengfaniella alkalisoli TaxID=2599296 RepID=A0A5B8IUE9_9RHOB|nr:DNA polymerase III subunit delta' [Qingshengfaniella alkalisoli]QDY68481.1 DNA polymerase III subunit delta' [Qingshengfaniella alkalisoli]